MEAVGEGMECTRSLRVWSSQASARSWRYVWLNWWQRLEELFFNEEGDQLGAEDGNIVSGASPGGSIIDCIEIRP